MDKKKILIIEDEQSLMKALTEVLQDKYKVLNAIDGEAGLEMVKQERPDLVILDLILPRMDGFEVLREIRGDEGIKNIPVLVLTNLSDVADKIKSLGGDDCCVKSDHSIDEIQEKIKKQIGE